MSACKMRFVSDALFQMVADGVALEGDALRGLHELVEDHVLELQAAEKALERDCVKAEEDLRKIMDVLVRSGAL